MDIRQYIIDNEDADLGKLLLNPPAEFQNQIGFIVTQIKARRKIRKKLPRWYAIPELIYPSTVLTEQCSSEETAAYKSQLMEGRHLVDLTGGLGIDLIAFQTQFEKLTYVEKKLEYCEAFKANSSTLNAPVEILNQRAEDYLEESSSNDLCFIIDPARRNEKSEKIFRIQDCEPNLLAIWHQLKRLGRRALVKLSPLVDIKDTLSMLAGIKEVHVVASKNEVKEVLLLADFTSVSSEATIVTVNLDTGGSQVFSVELWEENQASVDFGPYAAFIYLPNASILKSGSFKLISEKFGLVKLAANTHLYTSDRMLSEFPGRIFRVRSDVRTLGKKEIRGQMFNVITRNYPESPAKLVRRLQIREGGTDYLIGFRDLNNKANLLYCSLESAGS